MVGSRRAAMQLEMGRFYFMTDMVAALFFGLIDECNIFFFA